MPSQPSPEKSIYYEAIGIQDPDRRAAYLDVTCRHDADLRRRVQSLLDADEQAGQFLEGALIDELVDMPETAAGRIEENAGTVIGRYKLLEKIGEGGFGVVFMAEQREPIVRRVALKIIKEGMDTKQVIARFEAERQALSLMNHPNIAMVLDAGRTDTGRPYFVMELVRGTSITQYCDHHHMDTADRLKLFTDVCSAVQHAHQKGVIHRDIKPTNVLVTDDGDRSVAKVIDFGVAKATQGRLTDKTLFTCFRQFIGTPAYMSPEQAGSSLHDIDTRTDVYSLGVLLYELLTGTTPLDQAKLQNAALDEVTRCIRDDEPQKPSARVSTMAPAHRARVAGDRKTEPDRLGRLVRGELDWIVMKAIDKDRTRRYETASGLSADVSRFLTNEPVEAGPPTIFYQLQKFAARNWVATSTITTIAATLIVGILVSTYGLVQARRAERDQKELKASLAIQLRETEQAREMAEHHLYLADLSRISTVYDEGSLALAMPLLDKHRIRYGDRFEWRYLNRMCHTGDAIYTLLEHQAPVTAVVTSVDGRVASGDANGVVCVLDVASKTKLAQISMSTGIKALAFAPDGRLLAVAEESNNVSLYDCGKHRVIAVCDGSDAGVSDVSFAPDNGVLLITPNRVFSPLRIWNLQTQELVVEPSDTTYGRRMEISPDGASISRFGPGPDFLSFARWESESARRTAAIWEAHEDSLADLAFSQPDGRYVASSAGDEIKIWKMEEVHEAFVQKRAPTPETVMRGRHQGKGVRTLAFSPDGRFLATGQANGSISLWRGRPNWHPEESDLITLRGHTGSVTSIAYSSDGYIVSGSEDQTVRFWAGDGRPSSNELMRLEDSIHAVDVSPDGQLIVAGGFDGRLRIVRADSLEVVFDERLHENQIMDVAISPNGKWLASSEGGWRKSGNYDLPGRGVSVINLDSREDRYHFTDVTSSVAAIDFSPDSNTLVIGGADGRLWSLDMISRRGDEPPVDTDGGMIWGLCYSPDGRTFAAVGKSRPLEIRDSTTLQIVTQVPSGMCSSVGFSPDGRLVVFGQDDGRIRVFDTNTKMELQSLKGHSSHPWSLDFLPDGKTLASAGLDRTVRLWDVTSGNELLILRGHQGHVRSLTASPDGNLLISAGDDNTLRFWRASERADLR